jgi:hypothetical protein
MHLPSQALPVQRSRRGVATSSARGVHPQADYQCWTEANCGGLTHAYVNNCDECKAHFGQSIRHMGNRSCTNC